MLPIDNEIIKRVENGDILVRGVPDNIRHSKFEDGWRVVHNLRATEQLEVEKSGIQLNVITGLAVKEKLPYVEFISNDWYILDRSEWHH